MERTGPQSILQPLLAVIKVAAGAFQAGATALHGFVAEMSLK